MDIQFNSELIKEEVCFSLWKMKELNRHVLLHRQLLKFIIVGLKPCTNIYDIIMTDVIN